MLLNEAEGAKGYIECQRQAQSICARSSVPVFISIFLNKVNSSYIIIRASYKFTLNRATKYDF